jgi:F-type H+-transporting ATPase subunit a
VGLEFLVRVRRSTLVLAALGALLVMTYAGWRAGVGTAAGALWSLANLWLIERLVVAITEQPWDGRDGGAGGPVSRGLSAEAAAKAGPSRARADRAREGGIPGAAGCSEPRHDVAGPWWAPAAPAAVHSHEPAAAHSHERIALHWRRAVWPLLAMIALFAAGAWLLARLPAEALVAGFLLPFAVMLFKAVALVVMAAPFWGRIARTPLRALALVAAMAVLAWATAALLPGLGAAQSPAVAHAPAVARTPVPSAGESEAGGGPERFPNLVTVLAGVLPNPWSHQLHRFEPVLFSILVALILGLVAFFATRKPQLIPGGLQNGVEWAVESLYDFVCGILGPTYGRRYAPYLGTLFLYILAMNLFGLIPFMDSPTSNLNVTVGLAIITFLYVQWTGLRELGVLGYLHHLAGNPRSALTWAMVPIMVPVHIIGELAKPVSLSCRLFGNVFGEDMLLVAFTTLGVASLSFLRLPFGLPLQIPFLLLALLTSTIQALVFTVLSTIYFLLMLPHEEHGHEEAAQPAT